MPGASDPAGGARAAPSLSPPGPGSHLGNGSREASGSDWTAGRRRWCCHGNQLAGEAVRGSDPVTGVPNGPGELIWGGDVPEGAVGRGGAWIPAARKVSSRWHCARGRPGVRGRPGGSASGLPSLSTARASPRALAEEATAFLVRAEHLLPETRTIPKLRQSPPGTSVPQPLLWRPQLPRDQALAPEGSLESSRTGPPGLSAARRVRVPPRPWKGMGRPGQAALARQWLEKETHLLGRPFLERRDRQ